MFDRIHCSVISKKIELKYTYTVVDALVFKRPFYVEYCAKKNVFGLYYGLFFFFFFFSLNIFLALCRMAIKSFNDLKENKKVTATNYCAPFRTSTFFGQIFTFKLSGALNKKKSNIVHYIVYK